MICHYVCNSWSGATTPTTTNIYITSTTVVLLWIRGPEVFCFKPRRIRYSYIMISSSVVGVGGAGGAQRVAASHILYAYSGVYISIQGILTEQNIHMNDYFMTGTYTHTRPAGRTLGPGLFLVWPTSTQSKSVSVVLLWRTHRPYV